MSADQALASLTLRAPRRAYSTLQLDGELAKWQRILPVNQYLVLATNDYIVYIDKDTDVGWEILDDGETGTPGSGKPRVPDQPFITDTPEFHAVLNRMAALETTPCDELGSRMKLHFKRLLGEGLARALDGDYPGANSIFDTAADYVLARSQEKSRQWYLSASAAMTVPFIVLALVLWQARDWVKGDIGDFAFWTVLSGCAGAIGALLSVIGRTGKQNFDSSAGRHLHYLEAASRIWAGAISGVLVGLAVQAGLFLTALTRDGNMPVVVMLAGLASGASERLAKSIIADLGSGASDKDKKSAEAKDADE